MHVGFNEILRKTIPKVDNNKKRIKKCRLSKIILKWWIFFVCDKIYFEVATAPSCTNSHVCQASRHGTECVPVFIICQRARDLGRQRPRGIRTVTHIQRHQVACCRKQCKQTKTPGNRPLLYQLEARLGRQCCQKPLSQVAIMNIKLYNSKPCAPCSFVRVVGKEIGIEFELIDIELFKGDHLTPEFQKINPFRMVPVLNDNGFVIYER